MWTVWVELEAVQLKSTLTVLLRMLFWLLYRPLLLVEWPAHVYGTSPSNQSIESWWSFFRRNHWQTWIDVFENITQQGLFQGLFAATFAAD